MEEQSPQLDGEKTVAEEKEKWYTTLTHTQTSYVSGLARVTPLSKYFTLALALFVAFFVYEIFVFNSLSAPVYSGGTWSWEVALPYTFDDGEGSSWRYNSPMSFFRFKKYPDPIFGVSLERFFHKEQTYYLCVGNSKNGVPFVEQMSREWFEFRGYRYYVDLSSQEYTDLLKQVRGNQVSKLTKEVFLGPGYDMYATMPSYGRESVLAVLGTPENPYFEYFEGYVSRSSSCDSIEKLGIHNGSVEKFLVRFLDTASLVEQH